MHQYYLFLRTDSMASASNLRSKMISFILLTAWKLFWQFSQPTPTLLLL